MSTHYQVDICLLLQQRQHRVEGLGQEVFWEDRRIILKGWNMYQHDLVVRILIFWRFRLRGIAGIVLIIIAIGLSDYITSGIMKPFFERLRPCHNPEISYMVHLVSNCGGKYGFASGHAANSFALASSLFLIYRKQIKYLGWMYLWASIVAYSRIYVGVHYPFDVITGALIGIVFSIFICIISTKLPDNFRHKGLT